MSEMNIMPPVCKEQPLSACDHHKRCVDSCHVTQENIFKGAAAHHVRPSGSGTVLVLHLTMFCASDLADHHSQNC